MSWAEDLQSSYFAAGLTDWIPAGLFDGGHDPSSITTVPDCGEADTKVGGALPPASEPVAQLTAGHKLRRYRRNSATRRRSTKQQEADLMDNTAAVAASLAAERAEHAALLRHSRTLTSLEACVDELAGILESAAGAAPAWVPDGDGAAPPPPPSLPPSWVEEMNHRIVLPDAEQAVAMPILAGPLGEACLR